MQQYIRPPLVQIVWLALSDWHQVIIWIKYLHAVNWTFENKFQLNHYKNTTIFIQENKIENVIDLQNDSNFFPASMC